MVTSKVYDVLIELPPEWFEAGVSFAERLKLIRGEMTRQLAEVDARVAAVGGQLDMLVGTLQVIVRADEDAWGGALTAFLAGNPLLRLVPEMTIPSPDTVEDGGHPQGLP